MLCVLFLLVYLVFYRANLSPKVASTRLKRKNAKNLLFEIKLNMSSLLSKIFSLFVKLDTVAHESSLLNWIFFALANLYLADRRFGLSVWLRFVLSRKKQVLTSLFCFFDTCCFLYYFLSIYTQFCPKDYQISYTYSTTMIIISHIHTLLCRLWIQALKIIYLTTLN